MQDVVQRSNAVGAYKHLLAEILLRRPSGTRQRLAVALGKNRSFVSQIANPAYATPIPANHLEVIFEVCHFSAEEKRRFIALYAEAHPDRPASARDAQRLKAHTVYLPDLGDEARNRRLHDLVTDFVRQLSRLVGEQPRKRKRK
jgi:hypothetical protein